MKPDIKDIPPEANWIAQDMDGWWYWYGNEPYKMSRFWFVLEGGQCGQIHKDEPNFLWFITLERIEKNEFI